MGKDVRGFRLILSEGGDSDGQRMKKFEKKPLSIEQIISYLKEFFNLEEFLQAQGESTDPTDIRQSFTFIGHDGPRRVPLRTDDNLVSFLRGLQNTDLPSIEAQFSQQGKKQGDRDGFLATRGKDHVERLEDENKRLLLRWEKTERRMDDFERQRTKDLEEMRKFINSTWQQMQQKQAEGVESLQGKIFDLQEADAKLGKNLSEEQQAMQNLKQMMEVQNGSVSQHLEQLGNQMSNVRDDFSREVKQMKDKQQRLIEEDARLNEVLVGHTRQLTIMEQSKVESVVWEENNRKVDERMVADQAQLNRRLDESETQLSLRLAQTHAELKAADAAISQELHRDVESLTQSLNQVQEELRNLEEFQSKRLDDLQQACAIFEQEMKDLVAQTDANARQDFKARIDSTDADLLQKDVSMHRRVDETNTKLEDLSKVTDSNLATLDKAIADTAARLRAELRSEAERLRSSLDQEVARLDEEMDAGHKKYDITKAELNFCQSRVTEQREWSQKLFAERESATEAVQVEAVEGMKALNRMLHALKDDEVAFREKMANHIKGLQGDSTNHGEQLGELEQQRKRMRLDLDGLAEDYHEYVGDMDGWSGDVRRKVEKLFRSMEPTKVEWRIEKISQKMKKIVKPMTLRSPAFNISGIKEIRFDFYPNGHYSSPEGCGVLRIYAPAGTNIKYEAKLGKLTEGAMEWENGQDSLWTDVIFTGWESEVRDGDHIVLEFEVLANHAENSDEVLGKTLRIDNP